jgi:cell wall-associated NlpC family hydrolase
MTPLAGADLAMWGAAPEAAHASVHTSVAVRPAIRRLANRLFARTSKIAMSLERNAMRFVGVPYSFGGTSSYGFDCSGYVQHVFAMMGIHLPRTADAQYAVGRHVRAPRKGDLVFFQTYAAGASHVGIYLGHGKFIHSSSSHGVMVSHLSDSYWASAYLGAKRIVRD